MPDLHVRRRAGGDEAGGLYLRRRAGGDIALAVKGITVAPEPTPPPVVDRDHVAEFLAATPFYVAHRLGGTEYPEFTRRGLDASLAAGFKALELSVRRCATGEFVLIHDWVTTRTVPGTDYQIWNTPWSVLAGLQQASGGFLRLTDVMDSVPQDVVLAIDHKVTSDKQTSSTGDMESEAALFALLEERLGPAARRRVLIKHFIQGGVAARAKARGYRTMCMMYPNEVAGADLTTWDVLGMEWNASDDVWAQLHATGKPLIAHIITTQAQATRARERGATGLMSSVPSQVHP
nr:MAG TPA: Glycerophosphoryl diester phosphodiesterase [Caudoviricetes sp.]